MVSNILTKDRKIRNRKIILSFFALPDYADTKKKEEERNSLLQQNQKIWNNLLVFTFKIDSVLKQN